MATVECGANLYGTSVHARMGSGQGVVPSASLVGALSGNGWQALRTSPSMKPSKQALIWISCRLPGRSSSNQGRPPGSLRFAANAGGRQWPAALAHVRKVQTACAVTEGRMRTELKRTNERSMKRSQGNRR